MQNEMNYVVFPANIITFKITTSFTNFCLERETKKNSLDFALPKQVGKKDGGVYLFLVKLGAPHTFGAST